MAEKRTDGDAVAVWAAYASDRSTANRNAVVRLYLPLVTLHANKMKSSVPRDLDRGDLMQAGVLGLIRAVELFDSDRGLKFETYAGYRVRGAMLDWMRDKNDWFQRGVRADHPEIKMFSYDVVGEDHSANESDNMHDKLECLSYEDTTIITSQRLVDLRLLLLRLPDRSRRVLDMRFRDGMSCLEIGAVIGVSESRVSQIIHKTINTLRRIMGVRGKCGRLRKVRGRIQSNQEVQL